MHIHIITVMMDFSLRILVIIHIRLCCMLVHITLIVMMQIIMHIRSIMHITVMVHIDAYYFCYDAYYYACDLCYPH